MKFSFRSRILMVISLACVICTVAAVFVSSQKLAMNGQEALGEKSRAILSRLEVGARYVAEMQTLDGVIAETIQKFPDGNLSEEQKLKVLKSVPVFAALKIGAIDAEKENYQFRVATESPRNKRNQADAAELAVIRRFQADPKLTEISEVTPDGKFMRVTRPVRISAERGCLNCHGHPSTSPWKNGKDILGFKMEDMKDGDLKATFTIISSLEPVQNAVKASTRDIILWALFFTALALLIGFLVIRRPIDGLTSMASQLSASAGEVAAMSTQIAATSEMLSGGATEQSSALQESSTSMEEMSAMVMKNAENALKSQNLSKESQARAERGKEVVENMIRSIERIDRSNADFMAQVENSNRQIGEIVQVIAEIGSKTKVINDIVFQTKLLSFNASVEAARAGENGKGFAVVAEEVGNLARMSGSAAAEISQMLESSMKKVEGIVKETTEKVDVLVKAGKAEVEAGTLVAKQCGEVLNEVVASAEGLNRTIGEIAAASQEQAEGVQEINRAMAQLNEVTHQNATASQESSGAADRLSTQAEALHSFVQALMQTLNGAVESVPTGTSRPAASVPKANQGPLAQVIPLRPTASSKQAKEVAPARGLKKAVGHKGLVQVPAESDSRFEDV